MTAFHPPSMLCRPSAARITRQGEPVASSTKAARLWVKESKLSMMSTVFSVVCMAMESKGFGQIHGLGKGVQLPFYFIRLGCGNAVHDHSSACLIMQPACFGNE